MNWFMVKRLDSGVGRAFERVQRSVDVMEAGLFTFGRIRQFSISLQKSNILLKLLRSYAKVQTGQLDDDPLLSRAEGLFEQRYGKVLESPSGPRTRTRSLVWQLSKLGALPSYVLGTTSKDGD